MGLAAKEGYNVVSPAYSLHLGIIKLALGNQPANFLRYKSLGGFRVANSSHIGQSLLAVNWPSIAGSVLMRFDGFKCVLFSAHNNDETMAFFASFLCYTRKREIPGGSSPFSW